MECDCCAGPEGRLFLYQMIAVNAVIRFCSKHVPFFEKCAGKVVACD